MKELKYKRILLKISGETFCEPGGFGIDGEKVKEIAERIAQLRKLGTEISIVVGAGNLLRGAAFSKKSHIPRHTADYMGMLATVINACALQETLEGVGQPTRVLSAIEVSAICEPFIRRRALRHLEQGRVVILAGGTGNPFFSTDTCAALRASELEADIVIKATKVDGVFDSDPVTNPNAKRFDKMTYQEVLEKGLKVMDQTAISLCSENDIPVIVLNIFNRGDITRALQGEKIGTLISNTR